MDIYNILSSKPHNKFYLDRYIKFINYCIEINKKKTKEDLGYCENHHILPKAKDLFPEYKSLKEYPWNCANLTSRQHFICHYFLYKCFGNSQLFAFWAMNNQKGNNQDFRYTKFNSKMYANLRQTIRENQSKACKGKASYKDKNGTVIWCSTQDPKVLSGEYISLSAGRKIPKHSEKTKKQMSISAKKAKHNPNKTKKLYFLDIRITVLYHSELFTLLLEQGWSSNRTKEYRIKQIRDLHCNKKRSTETKEKISKAHKGKPGKKLSKEEKIHLRKLRSGKEFQPTLYFDIQKNIFKYTDLLFEQSPKNFIKVFVKGRVIWDEFGKKRFCNKNCPTPEGYYSKYPFEEFKIYNTITKKISIKVFKEINENIELILKTPNGNRLKFYCSDIDCNIYLNQEFISEFGIPFNCY